MPNTEILNDAMLQNITETENIHQAYFSTIDLKYACNQLQLHKDTAKYVFFNIICGE